MRGLLKRNRGNKHGHLVWNDTGGCTPRTHHVLTLEPASSFLGNHMGVLVLGEMECCEPGLQCGSEKDVGRWMQEQMSVLMQSVRPLRER